LLEAGNRKKWKGDGGMAIDWEHYGRDHYERDSRHSSGYQTHSYVEGNTVRKASAAPERKEETRQRPQPKRYPQRKPVRMPGISAKSFVFLTAMLSAVIFCSFSYLSTQDDVRNMKSEVVALQSEIAQQKEDNDENYQAVVASVDLAEIYEKATEKLKMVQAETNQIYTYSSKKSDMVKQYADIPGADK
jgi:cell division protein FtsL